MCGRWARRLKGFLIPGAAEINLYLRKEKKRKVDVHFSHLAGRSKLSKATDESAGVLHLLLSSSRCLLRPLCPPIRDCGCCVSLSPPPSTAGRKFAQSYKSHTDSTDVSIVVELSLITSISPSFPLPPPPSSPPYKPRHLPDPAGYRPSS